MQICLFVIQIEGVAYRGRVLVEVSMSVKEDHGPDDEKEHQFTFDEKWITVSHHVSWSNRLRVVYFQWTACTDLLHTSMARWKRIFPTTILWWSPVLAQTASFCKMLCNRAGYDIASHQA